MSTSENPDNHQPASPYPVRITSTGSGPAPSPQEELPYISQDQLLSMVNNLIGSEPVLDPKTLKESIRIGDTIRLESIARLSATLRCTPSAAVDFCNRYHIPVIRINQTTYYNLPSLETVLFYLLRPGTCHMVMGPSKYKGPDKFMPACYNSFPRKTELNEEDDQHLTDPVFHAEMILSSPKVRRKALFTAAVSNAMEKRKLKSITASASSGTARKKDNRGLRPKQPIEKLITPDASLREDISTEIIQQIGHAASTTESTIPLSEFPLNGR